MSFYQDTPIRATRRPHLCDGCDQQIVVGSPATRWRGLCDGEFVSAIWHAECRAAECEYNQAKKHWEWVFLRECLEDQEDRAWLMTEHPAVAARFGLLDNPPCT